MSSINPACKTNTYLHMHKEPSTHSEFPLSRNKVSSWDLSQTGDEGSAVHLGGIGTHARAAELTPDLDGYLPVVLPHCPGTQRYPRLHDGSSE